MVVLSEQGQQVTGIEMARKYPCNLCDYKAKYPTNLADHISAVHEGVIYDCKQCPFNSKKKQYLTSACRLEVTKQKRLKKLCFLIL